LSADEGIGHVIAEVLPIIDQGLAVDDMEISQRPFWASFRFAQHFIQRVRAGGKEWEPDFDSLQFASEPWFKELHRSVSAWYRARYPGAFDRSPRTARGVVLIWGTPFLIEVPLLVTSPGTPGKTVWLSFPDSVRDDEDAMNWVSSSPDLSQIEPEEQTQIRALVSEVASSLRRISVAVMGIGQSDAVVSGFAQGIMVHLQSAADRVIQHGRRGGTSRGYWEIQMACESAFKALSQHVTGEYTETHDLFYLYDRLPEPPAGLQRDLLRQVPRWQDVADLRYGQRADPQIADFFQCYRSALVIVAALVDPIASLRFGKASFEIARAPWLSDH